MDLPLIWVFIIAFVLLMYVIFDGFNLGVGLLFPFLDPADRPLAMTTVSPVWDGNETWLVMAAAMSYGAFPLAYSTLLPALYIPLILMVIALIFRGISFEFLFKAEKSRTLWDLAFSLGSYGVVGCQGIVLGAIVQGPTSMDVIDLSNPLYWLTPFSILSGMGLMAGYAYLGSSWLIIKTTGRLQTWSYKAASHLVFAFFGAMAITAIFTPYVDPFVIPHWFENKSAYAMLAIAFLAWLAFAGIYFSLKNKKRERIPFLLGILIFILAFLGLALSSFPYIVPHFMTYQQAASNHMTLIFLFYATLVVLPIILLYFGYSYYVFRGKVKSADELH